MPELNKIYKKINIKKAIRALAIGLELLAVALIVYLVVMPLYPSLKYNFTRKLQAIDDRVFQDASTTIETTNKIINRLPKNGYTNRIIIEKIGVEAPIIRSVDSKYALSRGAWMSPDKAYPGQKGNVVISGHRFKYLPPNNLTFYLLDKLVAGDMISIYWNNKVYAYKVNGSKVVLPTDLSVLASSDKATLTLYTCTPIFSEKYRLIITADLVK